jgi:preprotein translocase subunit SecE
MAMVMVVALMIASVVVIIDGLIGRLIKLIACISNKTWLF